MYTQIVRHGEGTLHYYSYSQLYTASVYTHATLNLTNFIKKISHKLYCGENTILIFKVPEYLS